MVLNLGTDAEPPSRVMHSPTPSCTAQSLSLTATCNLFSCLQVDISSAPFFCENLNLVDYIIDIQRSRPGRSRDGDHLSDDDIGALSKVCRFAQDPNQQMNGHA